MMQTPIGNVGLMHTVIDGTVCHSYIQEFYCTELWALSLQEESAGEGLSGHRATHSPDGSTQVAASLRTLPADTLLVDQ